MCRAKQPLSDSDNACIVRFAHGRSSWFGWFPEHGSVPSLFRRSFALSRFHDAARSIAKSNSPPVTSVGCSTAMSGVRGEATVTCGSAPGKPHPPPLAASPTERSDSSFVGIWYSLEWPDQQFRDQRSSVGLLAGQKTFVMHQISKADQIGHGNQQHALEFLIEDFEQPEGPKTSVLCAICCRLSLSPR